MKNSNANTTQKFKERKAKEKSRRKLNEISKKIPIIEN